MGTLIYLLAVWLGKVDVLVSPYDTAVVCLLLSLDSQWLVWWWVSRRR